MKTVLALALGYLVGAKSGGKDLDQLGQSLKRLCGTDEFADVLHAARSQAASTLRGIATMVDGEGSGVEPVSDLVARVRSLVDHH
jgi:hypothetical protein